MKKIIALISLLLLTACTTTDNHDYNTETFVYKYVHVECTTNAVMHDEIEKWYNDNDGTLCYIKTKNYGWKGVLVVQTTYSGNIIPYQFWF